MVKESSITKTETCTRGVLRTEEEMVQEKSFSVTVLNFQENLLTMFQTEMASLFI